MNYCAIPAELSRFPRIFVTKSYLNRDWLIEHQDWRKKIKETSQITPESIKNQFVAIRGLCGIGVLIGVRDITGIPAVIFLPARPASQTHDSHKGRMILNHVNPAGRNKNCGEKSAFKNLQLSFWTFFYLRTVSWIILVKTGTEILPNSLAIITSLEKHVFSDIHGEFTGKSQCR